MLVLITHLEAVSLASQTVSNMVVVRLGSDGAVGVYNAVGSVDVIVNVSGLVLLSLI